ncbi:hypothetical protein Sango_2913500 [Sesamum angolense]|uniref:DUF4216 domain-containing protein n=1 Tax=Sesamum angolense TaxID=2727404 RepID=A0AAE1VYT9_9LAMI|nr:hypothetical protein Sango_2913500 [Sesamum angolense]
MVSNKIMERIMHQDSNVSPYDGIRIGGIVRILNQIRLNQRKHHIIYKRLYYSRTTAEHVMWYAIYQMKEGSICYPSDAKAWKHFDWIYPDFVEELYNTFITWETLMWIVNDIPAYGMVSGWSTAGVIECSICVNDTCAFHLQHGRKACYFDCHKWFLLKHYPYRSNKKAFMKNCDENKCHWVDAIRGMKVQPGYHLVDVNFKKLYHKDDPFILAQQAVQVYFTDYHSMKRDKAE